MRLRGVRSVSYLLLSPSPSPSPSPLLSLPLPLYPPKLQEEDVHSTLNPRQTLALIQKGLGVTMRESGSAGVIGPVSIFGWGSQSLLHLVNLTTNPTTSRICELATCDQHRICGQAYPFWVIYLERRVRDDLSITQCI